ncbi:MAG: AI-2E family transporter [Deltaproteobacteria bacterium]|nr:AI-2E family transporter [Deltaproteobacteria bacterium]
MQDFDTTRGSRQIDGLQTAAFLIILFWGISEARPLLIPLSIAGLLAFLLAPFVRLMKSLRIPEWLAITLSTILLLLPFSAVGYLLLDQGQALSHDFPKIIRSLNRLLNQFAQSSIGHRLNVSSELDITMLTNRLAQRAGEGIQILLTGLGALLNAGSQTALVLLFTVLMLASRAHLRRSSEAILSNAENIKASMMLDEITRLIERFLISRALIVVIIGAADLAILMIFGINYAALLAAILGLLTIVPAIGFILAVIPPILVSLTTGHSVLATALLVGCLFIMSIIEGNVLTPRMSGKSLNINALTSFVGLFAGGLIWGLWGMFLAIPILGIVRIAFSASPRTAAWGDLLSDKPAVRITGPRVELKRRTRRPPEAGHA